MNIRRLYRCITFMLCLVLLLGTSRVFALNSGAAPDGSVNIIPPDATARLQVKLTNAGSRLSITKVGSKISSDLDAGGTFIKNARPGEEFQISYSNEAGTGFNMTAEGESAGANVYGDLDMAGSSATSFRSNKQEGRINIRLTGGDASFVIKTYRSEADQGTAGRSAVGDSAGGQKAESNIVLTGEFDGTKGRRGSVHNTASLDSIPEAFSYDRISTRITMNVKRMAAPANAEHEYTSGTVTWHKQYKDNHHNHASIFKLNIGGVIHDAACADGKNWKTAETGQAVSLARKDAGTLFAKIAYLASIDTWQKSNYNELDYYFALVCAARRANGRIAHERAFSKPLTDRMMRDAQNYSGTIPDNFRTYLASPTNGAQMMLAWGLRPYGKIEVIKAVGNNVRITGECAGAYSLAGAVYTVYDEAGNVVGTLTTDQNGKTGSIDVKPGKYTVKETTAPVGYELDHTVYSVESKADTTSIVKSYDTPVFAPVKIFLEKKSGGDSYMNPGDMTGAEFEVKYYDTIGKLDNVKAIRTWKLRTGKDASGKYVAELRAKNLVKGSDELFVTEQGDAVIPRGTVTIRETKAPAGYLLDKTVYTKKIDGDGTGSVVYFNSGVPSSHVNNPAIPKIGTRAIDVATKDSVAMYGPETTIRDIVSFTGLYEGETYTVEGIVMDKSTGKPLEQNGKKLTAGREFTATAQNSNIENGIASGHVEVEFKLDTTKLGGKNIVIFETLKYRGKEIANHRDLQDSNQTLHHPAVKTEAHSADSGDNTGSPSKEELVVDKVKYSNLVVGKRYKVSGVLMDKDRKKPILNKDGNEITSEKEFLAEHPSGEIELEFRYDSRLRQDKTTVVFETLLHENVPVAVHADINDESQSVRYPRVGTQLTGKDGVKLVGKSKFASLIDSIKYENLIRGRSYTARGVLIDKSTGKLYEEDGKAVTGSTTFTSEGTSTVLVEFKLNTSKLAGRELVAFERVYDDKGQLIAAHEDVNNRDQTIIVAPPTIPRTGDEASIFAYIVILLTAFLTLASLTAIRRCVRL